MITRRRFLQSSLAAALAPSLLRHAHAATLRVRPNWDNFCQSGMLQVYIDTVRTMRQNQDSTSPASWSYWAQTHQNNCPHGKPYFLAWHRGFLHRFEGWLRKVSGVDALVLPYWDYYTEPTVPSQFLDSTTSLYRKGRTGDDVSGALSMAPFADTCTVFPRGTDGAFESTLEAHPHNPVHDLIGGAMGSISYSPMDPLFWVHHANIDRLWTAWVKAGNGRQMPVATDSYWTGQFSYGPAIRTMPRIWTIDTSTYLGYEYEDESMPTATPAPASMLAAAASAPPVTETAVLGRAQPLVLDERSHAIRVALGTTAQAQVRSMLVAPSAASNDVRVVLEGLHMTAAGERGGYFYKVYLSPPQADPSSPDPANLLGTLGPFEVSVAKMEQSMSGGHGPARIVFPAAGVLRRIWPADLEHLTVSFVRVDAKGAARGPAMHVDRFVVEAAATP